MICVVISKTEKTTQQKKSPADAFAPQGKRFNLFLLDYYYSTSMKGGHYGTKEKEISLTCKFKFHFFNVWWNLVLHKWNLVLQTIS